MVNLLEQGLAWMNGMRDRHLATPVRYCRGNRSVDLAATVGRTTAEVSRDHGLFERIEARDYLVTAADLVIDGAPILPSPGDRILEESGNRRLIHEVMNLDEEPCFRWCDPFHITLRIHTKYISTEAASRR